jgi:N-acyl-D-aspartate/D-glutamate deacylase
MAYDLLLKNGRIVDGTGMPAFTGDVAIQDGRIAVRGKADGPAKRTIDCDGLVVAPGFVDVHTHYDAQVFWDPLLTSSCWHGFTTVMMTNCGFAFAPARPADRDYLMRTMTRVEGMQLEALEKGLPWNWETFAEYLAAFEGRIGLNVGAQVGHSALRRYVMGEDANARPATDDEIAGMRTLLRQMLTEGAFGFTSTRSSNHRGYYGEPVPSLLAAREELMQLADELGQFGYGGLEITPATHTQGFAPEERELLIELSLRSGAQVNWNSLYQQPRDPELWKKPLEYMDDAEKQGARIYGIARCQPLDLALNLGHHSEYFRDLPTWQSILKQDASGRLKAFADPNLRLALRDEIDGSPQARFMMSLLHMVKPALAKNAALAGKSVTELAASQHKHPVDALLDLAVEEGLDTDFEQKGFLNQDETAVAQFLKHPHVLVGVSDAGAHNDQSAGADFSTAFLQRWVRERQAFRLEEAVRQLTSVPAALLGLWDRGLIADGRPADIVVFNLDTVRPLEREWARDLPGGGRRIIQKAEGIEHVIVNGEPLLESGQPTGAMPGRVLRSSDYHRAGF